MDDNSAWRDALVRRLADNGFQTKTAATLSEAKAALAASHYDLVLLDLRLPDGDGLELVSSAEMPPQTSVVLVTDHFSKPVDVTRLSELVVQVRGTLASRQRRSVTTEVIRDAKHFGDLVGASREMQKVYDLIEQVAQTDFTALVLGETGTGKEVVARMIHERSARAAEPFVVSNIAALSSTIVESELFGHEKGSFTGAERLHRGVFEQGHRGTVFLDEIAETPPDLQAKLLRVLETRTVTRVGGEHPISVDVRVVAATNRDLKDAVAKARLREDLLYRLLVFPIHLPPLRERTDDIELLARHVVGDLNERSGANKRLATGSVAFLKTLAWPGNVRELKHTIERAYIIAGEELRVECFAPTASILAAHCQPLGASTERNGIGGLKSLAETEKEHILRTLALVDGDKPRAAAILGISLKTLYNRLKRF